MPDFYHASRTQLELGTVLVSRFIQEDIQFQFHAIASALEEGELVLKSLLLSDYWHQLGKPTLTFAMQETMLERTRRNEFPERPSRFASVFLCPTKDDILRFRETVCGDDDRPYLYVCSVADGTPLFRSDMALARGPNPLSPIKTVINSLVQSARLYWQGKKSENPRMEALTAPGIVKVTAVAEW